VGSLGHRVARLRELYPEEGGSGVSLFADWDDDAQLLWVALKVHDARFRHQLHDPSYKYHATDRELLFAEWLAATVEADIAGEGVPPFTPRQYSVGVVPDMFRFYIQRYEPVEEQRERDLWLYQRRARLAERVSREWVDWDIRDWTQELERSGA
jgi:hypothetical protein